MIVPVERLLLRLRHVPSRAAEVGALRDRVRAARDAGSAEERAAAVAVRDAKLRVAAAIADVTSCASCATGKRLPRGAFAGGDCCTLVTPDLFSDVEVAALAQAGTRARHLRAPRGVHAGCSFRGETGCTLAAKDRPERCVSYMCWTLRTELAATGQLPAIDALIAEARSAMARFAEIHARRLDDDILAPLEAELARLSSK